VSLAGADPSAALPGVRCAAGEVGCYTGLYEGRAWIVEPESIDQMRQVFAYARENDRRVTMRGAGHSFDGQPIGDDLVVSTLRLNAIELLDGARVRVGPGARWGEIFAATEPRGLIPAITVTTREATAGGTLSADCLSRFSPAYGKEGKWVESFDLLTTGGELLRCPAPPPDAGWDQLTREQRVFRGVIGGFGYLGAVVSITYRLLEVGASDDGQIGVRTFARTHDSFDRLARDLVPKTLEAHNERSDPNDPEKLDAIWSGLVAGRDGSERAFMFTSAFTPKRARRRLILHRPRFWPRVPYEWLLRVPWTARLLWAMSFRIGFQRKEHVDDVEDFTFFMDGNARAKRVGKRLGFAMRNVQQTFIVPFDPSGTDGPQAGQDALVDWLGTAKALMDERGLQPTLHDVLFLPGDEPFLLSSTAGGSGFACSYAFETSRESTLRGATEAFRDLADVVWERFGGKVHLVKNVYASTRTLGEMYGEGAERFFDLKRELDPTGTLRNDFLERTFGVLAA
jgi:decaprenylphospho-beta-D-ribofuranose 2-oxidase